MNHTAQTRGIARREDEGCEAAHIEPGTHYAKLTATTQVAHMAETDGQIQTRKSSLSTRIRNH